MTEALSVPAEPENAPTLQMVGPRQGQRARPQRAQVIYLVPLVMIFMITTIFLTLYTQRAVRERIQLQVASDTSAHAGTLVLAIGCDVLTLANDAITLGLITILKGLSELADPTTWVQAIKAIVDGVKTIKDATTLQNYVNKNGWGTFSPLCVLATNWLIWINFAGYIDGGFPIAVPIPKLFNNTLSPEDRAKYNAYQPEGWAQNISAKRVADILWVWKSLGRGSLGERSFVVGIRTKEGNEPSGNGLLLLMSMNQYWRNSQSAWSMAIPAFVLGHDPWDSTLNLFEQWYSLQVPGPWFDGHLADVISKIESAMTGYFEDKLLLKPNDWAKSSIKNLGTSNAAQGAANESEIEMVEIKVEEDEADDVEDE